MSQILYKYIDIEGAKYMLGEKNLQFTNASQLNDPFDCHPKLLDYSNVPKHKLQGWIPEEWWKMKEENDATNLRNRTWLCSLSRVNDSLLMWSHYCYNHKGVCIGLNIDVVKNSVPPVFDSIREIEVQYQDIIERPNAYKGQQHLFGGCYQWMAKAKDWEYEKEVRLIMYNPSGMYAALTPEQYKHPKEVWDGREIHQYLPLRGECFDSMYFGINIDQKERDKIIKFVCKKINPQIKLYQMQVDDNAFRLQPKPINNKL